MCQAAKLYPLLRSTHFRSCSDFLSCSVDYDWLVCFPSQNHTRHVRQDQVIALWRFLLHKLWQIDRQKVGSIVLRYRTKASDSSRRRLFELLSLASVLYHYIQCPQKSLKSTSSLETIVFEDQKSPSYLHIPRWLQTSGLRFSFHQLWNHWTPELERPVRSQTDETMCEIRQMVDRWMNPSMEEMQMNLILAKNQKYIIKDHLLASGIVSSSWQALYRPRDWPSARGLKKARRALWCTVVNYTHNIY